MHKYPSIENIFSIESIPDVGKRYKLHNYINADVKRFKDVNWWCTEKINGLNIRISYDGNNHVTMAGRNNKSGNLPGDETGVPELLNDTFHPDIMRRLFGNTAMTLYVEAFGHKLARNGHWYGYRPSLALLDVRIGNVWLEPENTMDVGDKLGLLTPPLVHRGPLDTAIIMVRNGMRSRFGDFPAEGLVCTPIGGLLNRKGERIITKIKTEFFHGNIAAMQRKQQIMERNVDIAIPVPTNVSCLTCLKPRRFDNNDQVVQFMHRHENHTVSVQTDVDGSTHVIMSPSPIANYVAVDADTEKVPLISTNGTVHTQETGPYDPDTAQKQ